MPALIFFAVLDLEQKSLFMDRHEFSVVRYSVNKVTRRSRSSLE